MLLYLPYKLKSSYDVDVQIEVIPGGQKDEIVEDMQSYDDALSEDRGDGPPLTKQVSV